MYHLISSHPRNSKTEFSESDSDKSLKKNKKKLGDDWEYTNKVVDYTYNEYGFRTRSFNSVNWKDAIVIFGCSITEGIGLAESDTISSQLEGILNIPVINLGISGTAIDLACWNSLILHNQYPHPRAVVHNWTSLSRYTDIKFTENDAIIDRVVPGESSYVRKLNWSNRSKFYVKADRALWYKKTLYTELTFFSDTRSAMSIDNDLCLYLDRARDMMHPGAKSARIVAGKIAENLKKQGI